MEQAVQSNEFATLTRLWEYLKQYKKSFFIIIFFVIVSTLLSVIVPILLQIIIDKSLINGNIKLFIYLLVGLGFLYGFKSLFTLFTNRRMAWISEQVLYEIRKDLFKKLETLDLSFFDRVEKGDLMSHFTNDITMISDALTEAVVEVITSTILIIGITIMMFLLNTIMAFVTIITVPIFFILVFKIGKKASDSFNKQQALLGELTGISEEIVSGMKTIQCFHEEDTYLNKFEKKNNSLRDVIISSQLYSGLIMPVNMMISNVGNIVLIFVGSMMVLKGNATIGMILAFLNYASMFRSPINSIAGLFASIGGALAGAKRIFHIMDEPVTVVEIENPVAVTKIKGDVKFEQVHFSYEEGQPVLSDVSFHANPGMMIAIVGPTGSGKTTIANLMTRFYDIQEGQILIDSIPIKNYSLNDLRKKIGMVLQDTYLQKGTIFENICYGVKANEAEVIYASKKAGSHEFIHRLPNGYQSLVEEGGTNFSEGEKQLLAITRIILKNPDILILDEATSQIDTKTELQIQRGMQELMRGKTSFVIAHRLSTIQNADTIFVISKGQIVEKGAHKELLQQDGFYKLLYNSQFEN